MGLSVQTNLAALNAANNLTKTQNQLSSSLQKLSSGFRINTAADDAAGLAISEGMRSQMGGITVGIRNAQDGISVVQTAEGALNETTSILQRMRDLSVQGANVGSLTTDASKNIQTEITKLQTTLDNIGANTKFNGQALLGGAYSAAFQVGANTGETINVAIATNASAAGLGVGAGVTTMPADTTVGGLRALDGNQTNADAMANVALIDTAIAKVSTERANLGATQNQFDHTINNQNVALQNVTASESRIRDTDMAATMVDFTKSQILSQAGVAMLAQAKSLPQDVLKLLQ
jgi:flagellin